MRSRRSSSRRTSAGRAEPRAARASSALRSWGGSSWCLSSDHLLQLRFSEIRDRSKWLQITLAHERHVITDGEKVLRIRTRDNHRGSVVRKFADQSIDLRTCPHVDATGWLTENVNIGSAQ